jgi:alkylated DNA repair dioxygenase AlkB
MFAERFVADPDALLDSVLAETEWDTRMRARFTASFGAPYNFSNMTYPETPIPDYLREACASLQERVGFLPNNCLINNYVRGGSTMGFHADSTEELVPGTGVAIVSLGATRTLTFRRTQERDMRWECRLPHGSLLYMPPEVQHEWQHAVLKEDGVGQRVSLTFRALR